VPCARNNTFQHSDRIELEFASFDRALEFIAANDSAAWLKLNGELMTGEDRLSAILATMRRSEGLGWLRELRDCVWCICSSTKVGSSVGWQARVGF
jgi:hypothetical protein